MKKKRNENSLNVYLQKDDVHFAYPWVVKGDPVFYPITKSLKAQIGVIVKEIDHAVVLPTTIFLLKNLKTCM